MGWPSLTATTNCSSSSILTTTPTRSITTPNMSPNMFVSQSSTAHRKYQQQDVNEDWEWNFSSHSNDVLRPFNSNIPNAERSPEWENEEQLRPQRDRDPPLQGSAP